MSIWNSTKSVAEKVIQTHYDWYFAIAMVWHIFIDGFTRFQYTSLRFTFYFMMALIGLFVVWKREYSSIPGNEFFKALAKSLGLAALAFFMPFIINMDIIQNSLGTYNADLIIAVFPVYLVYFFFIEPDLLSDWMQWLRKFYIIFFITIFTIWAWQAGQSQLQMGTLEFIPGLQGPAAADIWGIWGDLWKIIINFFKDKWRDISGVGLFKGINNFFNATINPEYYAGQTDTKAKEKLGVRLEQLKATDNTFYAGEPVSIYATLVADTLDRPFIARISCKAKSGQETGPDAYDYEADPNDIYPSPEYTVEDYSREEVDCTFNSFATKRGTYNAKMFVEFDFETQAYQKIYYVDKERARVFVRENKNVLDAFKITDKNPQTIFTDGPVSIGMSISKSQPVELDLNSPDNRLTLGLSIKNRWEGRLKNIKHLAIMMPKSITLDSRKCGNVEFVDGDCADMNLACDPNVYRVYDLKQGQANTWFSNIDSFKTIRCPLTINPSAILLGNSPLITEFFRVYTDYSYMLEKSVSVNIKEAGQNV